MVVAMKDNRVTFVDFMLATLTVSIAALIIVGTVMSVMLILRMW